MSIPKILIQFSLGVLIAWIASAPIGAQTNASSPAPTDSIQLAAMVCDLPGRHSGDPRRECCSETLPPHHSTQACARGLRSESRNKVTRVTASEDPDTEDTGRRTSQ